MIELKDRLISALGLLAIFVATSLVVLGIMIVAVPALVISWTVWIWDNTLRRKP